MSFKIITDSTATLSAEYLKKHDISAVTLFYLLNGEVYPAYDQDKPTAFDGFYDEMRKRATVSTSCANESQYFEEFEKAVKSRLTVLYVGFSSGISASFSCAVKAKEGILEKYPDAKIYCVDTLTGSLGQGHFVKEAVRLRADGKTAEEVACFITEKRRKLDTYLTVNDLYFLHKGGRIPKLSYHIGTLVKIKPLIKVSDAGTLLSVGKVISRKQSLLALFDIIKKDILNPNEATVYIAHADSLKDAQFLADKLIRELHIKEVVIDYLEPVIGAHAGPDSIAIFFYSDKN